MKVKVYVVTPMFMNDMSPRGVFSTLGRAREFMDLDDSVLEFVLDSTVDADSRIVSRGELGYAE